MKKLIPFVCRELKKKAWNSILQLSFGGAVIYFVAVTAGPGYGCGSGNTQLMEGVFQCARGEMPWESKILVLGGILLASLCWGRAASLYERRRTTR